MVDRQTPTVESDEELTRDATQRRAEPDQAAADAAARTGERQQAQETARETGDEPVADRQLAPDREPPTREERAKADESPAETEARRAESQSSQRAVTADRAASDVDAGPDLELFDKETSRDLRDRWLTIQMAFVDSPKDAVQKAEGLVGEVMQQLTDGFARQRRDLEAGWSKEAETSTEDLRLAIRRYRSFFNRLLAL